MINYCILTSLLYLIPLSFLLYKNENYPLCSFFLLLSIFAFSNHCRTYTDKPIYDVIDIIDRILIIIICSYFIIYYYESFFVWFALFYMIISYLYIIPRTKKRKSKVLIHSSFHIITSFSALLILIYYL